MSYYKFLILNIKKFLKIKLDYSFISKLFFNHLTKDTISYTSVVMKFQSSNFFVDNMVTHLKLLNKFIIINKIDHIQIKIILSFNIIIQMLINTNTFNN